MEGQFKLGQFAKFGRGGDDTIAHVASGERVIPNGILNAELTEKINSRMESFGLDPNRYVVGNKANSMNPTTGQPEFGFGDMLFGSKGDMGPLEDLTKEAEMSIRSLNATPGRYNDPLSRIYTGRGGISVRPTKLVTDITDAFGDQFKDQLGRMGQGANALQQAYEPFQYNRQDLQNMFTAGLPSAENAIAARTDSALGRILGGMGTSTGSAGIMAGAQREGDMARQQLRQNALTGASGLYNSEMMNYARNLVQQQALRTGDIAMLTSLASGQLDPMTVLGKHVPDAMNLGKQFTQFDMGKIGSIYNLGLPLAENAAKDTSGIFSSGGNWLGGALNMGKMAAGAYTGMGGDLGSIFGGGGGGVGGFTDASALGNLGSIFG